MNLRKETKMDKIASLLNSRRFWVAVGSALVVVLQDTIGLDEETANRLVAIAVSWIVGDSINKTK